MIEELSKNVGLLLAGISGGAVTLIQSARRRKKTHTTQHIVGSLFISAFAAWLLSMITAQFDLADGIRMAIAGIAGMSADRILEMVESKFIQELKGADLK